MIWKKCIFQKETAGTPDALGNPTYTLSDDLTALARHSPWTDEQIALEGRTVTSDVQRFVIPLPHSAVKDYEKVKLDNVVYDITEMIDYGPRFTVIQVGVYKK